MPDLRTQLEKAEEDRQQIILEVQQLQAQLGDKKKTDENGEKLPASEYWKWRQKTQHTLNLKLKELRSAKANLRALRSQEWKNKAVPVPSEALSAVRGLLEIIDTYEDDEFSTDEKLKILVARALILKP